MNAFTRDLRFSLRSFSRNPGFSAIAILTLALGIGANTAVFSVVDAVLLKPLPYPEPGRLLKLYGRFTGIGLPGDRNWFSPPEFTDLRAMNRSLAGAAAIRNDSFNLITAAEPERVQGAAVSPSFFDVLGVKPQLGRAFQAGSDQPGRDALILLGHGLWRRSFGADPNVIGRKVTVNGAPHVIAGVLPAGFEYPPGAELWKPLAFTAAELAPRARGEHGLEVLARTKPGLTPEQVRADLESVTSRMLEANPQFPYARFQFAIGATPLVEEFVADSRNSLWILMGAVALVLLIACADMANLLLARAAARGRELAIRAAIGAGRARLVRQLLTEAAVLSAAGAGTGVLMAYWGLRALRTSSAAVIPRMAGAQIDLRVLAFTALAACGAAVIFGLAPALQACRTDACESLKEGGRSATAGASRHRLRRALAGAEVALSLVLLAGAGLLIRSFSRLLAVDPGFRVDHVLTLRLSLPESKYHDPARVDAFYRDLFAGIERLPGVVAAGGTALLPFNGNASGTLTVDTQSVPLDRTTPEADKRPVTPGYFRAMGIPLLRGRYFDARDNRSSLPVAIIDETMAGTFWPNQDPIGRRIKQGGRGSQTPWMTIVGVVKHVRYRTLEAPSRVQLYWPEAQMPWPFLGIAVRTVSDPHALAGAVRKLVLALDPTQPVYDVRTLEEAVAESVARRRFSMVLLGLFAAIALALAAAGIYGVFSLLVSERRHEIGVRAALGASRGQILRLVLGQSLSLTLAGAAAGLAGAAASTRLLSSMLFGIEATDPCTFALATAGLVAAAMLASYLPARRAMAVAPADALRQE
jgi:predicted permease